MVFKQGYANTQGTIPQCRIVKNNNNNNPYIIIILTPERQCSDQAAENRARLQWRPLLLLPSGPGSCLALSEGCLLQPDPSGGKSVEQ